MADVSTQANRIAFANSVESGRPTIAVGILPILTECVVPLPITTAYALGLQSGATFAQGAALMQSRLAAGLVPM